MMELIGRVYKQYYAGIWCVIMMANTNLTSADFFHTDLVFLCSSFMRKQVTLSCPE